MGRKLAAIASALEILVALIYFTAIKSLLTRQPVKISQPYR